MQASNGSSHSKDSVASLHDLLYEIGASLSGTSSRGHSVAGLATSANNSMQQLSQPPSSNGRTSSAWQGPGSELGYYYSDTGDSTGSAPVATIQIQQKAVRSSTSSDGIGQYTQQQAPQWDISSSRNSSFNGGLSGGLRPSNTGSYTGDGPCAAAVQDSPPGQEAAYSATAAEELQQPVAVDPSMYPYPALASSSNKHSGLMPRLTAIAEESSSCVSSPTVTTARRSTTGGDTSPAPASGNQSGVGTAFSSTPWTSSHSIIAAAMAVLAVPVPDTEAAFAGAAAASNSAAKAGSSHSRHSRGTAAVHSRSLSGLERLRHVHISGSSGSMGSSTSLHSSQQTHQHEAGSSGSHNCSASSCEGGRTSSSNPSHGGSSSQALSPGGQPVRPGTGTIPASPTTANMSAHLRDADPVDSWVASQAAALLPAPAWDEQQQQAYADPGVMPPELQQEQQWGQNQDFAGTTTSTGAFPIPVAAAPSGTSVMSIASSVRSFSSKPRSSLSSWVGTRRPSGDPEPAGEESLGDWQQQRQQPVPGKRMTSNASATASRRSSRRSSLQQENTSSSFHLQQDGPAAAWGQTPETPAFAGQLRHKMTLPWGTDEMVDSVGQAGPAERQQQPQQQLILAEEHCPPSQQQEQGEALVSEVAEEATASSTGQQSIDQHHALLAVLNPLEFVLWQQRQHQRTLLDRSLHALTSLQADIDRLLVSNQAAAAEAAAAAEYRSLVEELQQQHQQLEQQMLAAEKQPAESLAQLNSAGVDAGKQPATGAVDVSSNVGPWTIKAGWSKQGLDSRAGNQGLQDANVPELNTVATAKPQAAAAPAAEGVDDFEAELLRLEAAAPGRRLSAETLQTYYAAHGWTEDSLNGEGQQPLPPAVVDTQRAEEQQLGDAVIAGVQQQEQGSREAHTAEQQDGFDDFEAQLLASEAAAPGRRLSGEAAAAAAVAEAEAAAAEEGSSNEQQPAYGSTERQQEQEQQQQQTLTADEPASPAAECAADDFEAELLAAELAAPGRRLSDGSAAAVAAAEVACTVAEVDIDALGPEGVSGQQSKQFTSSAAAGDDAAVSAYQQYTDSSSVPGGRQRVTFQLPTQTSPDATVALSDSGSRSPAPKKTSVIIVDAADDFERELMALEAAAAAAAGVQLPSEASNNYIDVESALEHGHIPAAQRSPIKGRETEEQLQQQDAQSAAAQAAAEDAVNQQQMPQQPLGPAVGTVPAATPAPAASAPPAALVAAAAVSSDGIGMFIGSTCGWMLPSGIDTAAQLAGPAVVATGLEPPAAVDGAAADVEEHAEVVSCTGGSSSNESTDGQLAAASTSELNTAATAVAGHPAVDDMNEPESESDDFEAMMRANEAAAKQAAGRTMATTGGEDRWWEQEQDEQQQQEQQEEQKQQRDQESKDEGEDQGQGACGASAHEQPLVSLEQQQQRSQIPVAVPAVPPPAAGASVSSAGGTSQATQVLNCDGISSNRTCGPGTVDGMLPAGTAATSQAEPELPVREGQAGMQGMVAAGSREAVGHSSPGVGEQQPEQQHMAAGLDMWVEQHSLEEPDRDHATTAVIEPQAGPQHSYCGGSSSRTGVLWAGAPDTAAAAVLVGGGEVKAVSAPGCNGPGMSSSSSGNGSSSASSVEETSSMCSCESNSGTASSSGSSSAGAAEAGGASRPPSIPGQQDQQNQQQQLPLAVHSDDSLQTTDRAVAAVAAVDAQVAVVESANHQPEEQQATYAQPERHVPADAVLVASIATAAAPTVLLASAPADLRESAATCSPVEGLVCHTTSTWCAEQAEPEEPISKQQGYKQLFGANTSDPCSSNTGSTAIHPGIAAGSSNGGRDHGGLHSSRTAAAATVAAVLTEFSQASLTALEEAEQSAAAGAAAALQAAEQAAQLDMAESSCLSQSVIHSARWLPGSVADTTAVAAATAEKHPAARAAAAAQATGLAAYVKRAGHISMAGGDAATAGADCYSCDDMKTIETTCMSMQILHGPAQQVSQQQQQQRRLGSQIGVSHSTSSSSSSRSMSLHGQSDTYALQHPVHHQAPLADMQQGEQHSTPDQIGRTNPPANATADFLAVCHSSARCQGWCCCLSKHAQAADAIAAAANTDSCWQQFSHGGVQSTLHVECSSRPSTAPAAAGTAAAADHTTPSSTLQQHWCPAYNAPDSITVIRASRPSSSSSSVLSGVDDLAATLPEDSVPQHAAYGQHDAAVTSRRARHAVTMDLPLAGPLSTQPIQPNGVQHSVQHSVPRNSRSARECSPFKRRTGKCVIKQLSSIDTKLEGLEKLAQQDMQEQQKLHEELQLQRQRWHQQQQQEQQAEQQWLGEHQRGRLSKQQRQQQQQWEHNRQRAELFGRQGLLAASATAMGTFDAAEAGHSSMPHSRPLPRHSKYHQAPAAAGDLHHLGHDQQIPSMMYGAQRGPWATAYDVQADPCRQYSGSCRPYSADSAAYRQHQTYDAASRGQYMAHLRAAGGAAAAAYGHGKPFSDGHPRHREYQPGSWGVAAGEVYIVNAAGASHMQHHGGLYGMSLEQWVLPCAAATARRATPERCAMREVGMSHTAGATAAAAPAAVSLDGSGYVGSRTSHTALPHRRQVGPCSSSAAGGLLEVQQHRWSTPPARHCQCRLQIHATCLSSSSVSKLSPGLWREVGLECEREMADQALLMSDVAGLAAETRVVAAALRNSRDLLL